MTPDDAVALARALDKEVPKNLSYIPIDLHLGEYLELAFMLAFRAGQDWRRDSPFVRLSRVVFRPAESNIWQ